MKDLTFYVGDVIVALFNCGHYFCGKTYSVGVNGFESRVDGTYIPPKLEWGRWLGLRAELAKHCNQIPLPT